MRLELGVGVTKEEKDVERRRYTFSPKLVGEDVVYVDLEIPDMKIPMFVRCDTVYLPFVCEAFEEIAASHLIEHLTSPLVFLSESFRVLSGSGILRLWLPNFVSTNALVDPNHKDVYNFFKIQRMIKSAGFSRVKPRANIGSRLPHIIRLALGLLFTLLCDELEVRAYKS